MKIPAFVVSTAKSLLLVEARSRLRKKQHLKQLAYLKSQQLASPKISMLVPVYNAETSLVQCLDSILNQTYTNIEIICVNDCSTDSSLAILERYREKDTRVKLVNKSKNEGSSFARRDALAAATGEYVLCVDSDDWIEPTMVEDLYLRASEGYDMVYCDYYKSGKITHPPRILEEADKFKRISKRSFSFGNMLWNRLVKKEVFDQVVFYPESMGEDVSISTQLYYYADKVAYLCKPLYHYNQFTNVHSVSARSNQQNIADMEANYRHIARFLKEKFGHQIKFEKEFQKKEKMFQMIKKKSGIK